MLAALVTGAHHQYVKSQVDVIAVLALQYADIGPVKTKLHAKVKSLADSATRDLT